MVSSSQENTSPAINVDAVPLLKLEIKTAKLTIAIDEY